MKLFLICETQRLPIPIKEAWKFFVTPKNLPVITPSSLGLQLTSELPDEMYPGMIITYNVTPLLGVSVSWVTEITHIAEPHLFVDEQRFGPYSFWHHKHFFREIEGGTEVEDMVHYALPLGPVGRVINKLIVRNQLEEIFGYRRHVLEKMFGKLP